MKLIKTNKLKFGIITILLIGLSLFVSLSTNAASSAPKTFTADSEKLLTGYINNWHYAKLTSSLGGYVYCQDFHKEIPYGVTMTLTGEAPAGIAYILSNGFPNKSITGDADKDYYITQAAVWWYLDETAGTNNLPDTFKVTGPDSYNLRQYIVKLVNEGKKITSYAKPAIQLNNQDTSLHLSENKKYYESNAISVKTLYTTGNYTIALSNAPTGTTVVNATSGSKQTSFKPSESFKVRIPIDNVKENSVNIKITATATGSINKAYKYKSSNSAAQDVIGSLLYPETSTVKDTTNLTLETSKVTITKIDADTNQPLKGATFVLKDSSGKEVATWTSTTDSHIIRNLPNGKYTLQETKAPDGYTLNDEVVTFTISDDNRNIAIRFKNKEIEKNATIIKIDSVTKKPVAGATLLVRDSSGKEIAKFTTTTQAHVLEDLDSGTYTVEELEAPKGYKKSDEIYKFTVNNTNRDVTVTIENQPIDKLVNILKVDAATNQPLKGATLVLKDGTGNVIEEFVTTEEAHTILNLKDGEYSVIEKEAPDGYKKSDEIYKFTISDESPTALVVFKNYEEVKVPFTGSNKSLISTLFGSVLLISGVGFVYYNGKKQKTK